MENYNKERIAFLMLGTLGIIDVVVLLLYSSPYPDLFSKYSIRHFNFLVAHIGVVGFIFLLLGVPRIINGLLKRVHDIWNETHYLRILGVILYIILGAVIFSILSRITHPSIMWVSTAFWFGAFALWFFLIHPTESRLKIYLCLYFVLISLMGVESCFYVYNNVSLNWRMGHQTMPQNPRIYDFPDLFVQGWPAGWNKRLPGPIPEGGLLLPDLDINVLGNTSPVRFITNSKGFRNAREFTYDVPAHIFRILYIGDSFASGFRIGQDNMSGQIIEKALNVMLNRNEIQYTQVEVLVASIDEPETGWLWLQEHGFKYNPSLVVLGSFLGNDIFQTSLAVDDQGFLHIQDDQPNSAIGLKQSGSRVGFTTSPYKNMYLPEDAQFMTVSRGWRFLRYHSSIIDLLSQAYISHRITRLFSLPYENLSISLYKDDIKNHRLHVFDPYHNLGLYYTPMLDTIKEALAQYHRVLRGKQAACQNNETDLLVVLFPPASQAAEIVWETTIKKYFLRSERFDLDSPNRRIIQQLEVDRIQYLDLLPVFREVDRQQREWIYLHGDRHWNDRGHQVAGQAIAKYIELRYLK